MAWFRGWWVPLLAGLALMSPMAYADEGDSARKSVEAFVAAYEQGDEPELRKLVAIPPEQAKVIEAHLDLMVATMQLRREAVKQYGESAGAFFMGVPGAAAESRDKAIREQPVKVTGSSAIMTLPADEKAKRPAGTIILVKSKGTWKLDGVSLFGLDVPSKITPDERAMMAKRLAEATDLTAKEIRDGKFDAMGAVVELNARLKRAAGQVEARFAVARQKEEPAPVKPPVMKVRYEMPERAQKLTDREIAEAMDSGAEVLLRSLEKEFRMMKELRMTKAQPPLMLSSGQNGEISLALYAILTAGRVTGNPKLRPSSKELKDAIDYVVAMRAHETYTVSLQAMALSLLPAKKEVKDALKAARDELVQGCAHGVYSYLTVRAPPSGDNSNTQYGQLGMWACHDAGIETPIDYWQAVDGYWRRVQDASGGWGYVAHLESKSGPGGPRTPDKPYASMTAAGVASLYLAQDYLDRSVELNPRVDTVMNSGMAWLTGNFETFHKDFGDDLYLAFSMERVALATGYKHIGEHDWYREGAVAILSRQRADKSWFYDRGSWLYKDRVGLAGTSYALLFLSRGIAPLACAKLEYTGGGGVWNARPRDCARFVHWLDKKTERTLNWQIVNVDSDPRDWRTPMVVISGHGDPKFTDEQIANLRQYVLGGGLIFSTADINDPEFTKAIRMKYAPAIFKNVYEMRLLPESHAAYQLDYKVRPPAKVHLYGLSNGVREVWVHSVDDVGSAWQSYSTASVQCFEVPANLYFYAMGRSKETLKLEALVPPAPPEAKMELKVARVIYPGNWEPEPAAWEKFARNCAYKYAATLKAAPTDILELDASKVPVAHMTGTTAFTLSDAQRVSLQKYLTSGGTLLVDSTAGGDAFTDSFREACKAILPEDKLEQIPEDSPVLLGNLSGQKLVKMESRRFSETPENRGRKIMIEQVKREGRTVILFSPGDLTAGIGGIRTWGIFGYTPETAMGLTWNSLVFLASQAGPVKEATTGPAGVASTGPATRQVEYRPVNLGEIYSAVSTPLGLINGPK